MLKYVNWSVVFQEIPDETTLSINISGCPCRCPGCHSKYLWADEGKPLTPDALSRLIGQYADSITCVGFMGGDGAPDEVERLAGHVADEYPDLRIAWYSGRSRVPGNIDRSRFNYIKLGPYIAHLGPLNRKTTNQHLYKRTASGGYEDITCRFWRK